ncbi:MAG: hypothetical protein ACYTFY_03255 [Planctomycetota bacterium]|jgi:hypothetical protein
MRKNRAAKFLEIILMVGLVPLAGSFLRAHDPFFITLNPHPFWGVIIFFSLRYSNPWGTFSGILCAAVHFSYLAIQGFNFAEAFHLGAGGIVVPFLYIVVGAVISEEISKHLKKNRFFAEEIGDAKKAVAESEKRRNDIEASYRQLEGRIAGSADTVMALHDHLRSLDGLEGVNLYHGISSLLCHFLNAENVGIWRYSGRKTWRCMTCDNDTEQILPELGSIALDKKKVVTAREFLGKDKISLEAGRLAGLLFSGKNYPDVVVIQDIGFKELHQQNIHFFELILEWISNVIERQRLRQMYKNTYLFESGLGLASEQFFYTSLKKELSRVIRTKELSTILICGTGFNLTEKLGYRLNIVLAACIRNLLRYSDSAAFIQDKGCFVMLLPLTDTEQSKIVQKKIQGAVDSLSVSSGKDKKGLEVIFKAVELNKESKYQLIMREVLGFDGR